MQNVITLYQLCRKLAAANINIFHVGVKLVSAQYLGMSINLGRMVDPGVPSRTAA